MVLRIRQMVLLAAFAAAAATSAADDGLPEAPETPATAPATRVADAPAGEVARLRRRLAQAKTLANDAVNFAQSLQQENQRLRGQVGELEQQLVAQRTAAADMMRELSRLRGEVATLKVQIEALRQPGIVLRPRPSREPIQPSVTPPATRPATEPASRPAVVPVVSAAFEGRVTSVGEDLAIIRFPAQHVVDRGGTLYVFRDTKLVARFLVQQVRGGSAMGRLTDVLEPVKAGDRVLRTENPTPATAPAPPPAAPAAPAAEGRVTAVSGTLAAISLGSKHGVTKGAEFFILQNGKLVATFVADRIEVTETAGPLVNVTGDVRAGDAVVPKRGRGGP